MVFAVAIKISTPTCVVSHSIIDCNCDCVNVFWVAHNWDFISVIPVTSSSTVSDTERFFTTFVYRL